MQCASGKFSASAATACTACSAGKSLMNAGGGTEEASCILVSTTHVTSPFLLGLRGLLRSSSCHEVKPFCSWLTCVAASIIMS